ncbi:MAG: DUF937 domain-containing protein [Hyphomicrobium sp.]|nr:DUF937 domain-containing protein [Hyphomicrobium sp.]
MEIEAAIKSAQGGAAIDNLASAFGIPPDKAASAVTAMTAVLANRVERNTLSRGGLADVVSLLGNSDVGRAIADPAHLATAEMAESGNHILDVLIGDKHISRGIAERVARDTGLDAATLRRMLPVVASMMVGGLQNKTQALFSQKLRDVPGLGVLLPLPGDPVPQRYDAPSTAPGSGEWSNDLPRPGGGSGGGMGGSTGGGVLLPLPGDNVPGSTRRNRYDDLSDVVRRGGTQAPGGGSLDGLIRSILGGLLGFKNRGVISSLIYMFVVRWLLNAGKRILSRIVLGR